MSAAPPPIHGLDGGPHDVKYFFDPGCPFGWQTSVWIRRVMALRRITVSCRFISLRFANEDDPNQPPEMVEAQERGLRYPRICAATRETLGNDAVGSLSKAWGERYWSTPGAGDMLPRLATSAQRGAPAQLPQSPTLPDHLPQPPADAT